MDSHMLEKEIRQTENKIKSFDQELQKIEAELEELNTKKNDLTIKKQAIESYLSGLTFSKKTIQNAIEQPKKINLLRKGSELAKIAAILAESNNPLHVDEILEKLDIPENERAAKKPSIAGTLNSYASKNRIFKRVGMNIFALITY